MDMIKIVDLRPGQGNVNVTGTIKEVGEPRTFNKFGRDLKVANAVFEDDSGTIRLTLWNDDCDTFKEGDVVTITNGYVNEFQGEKQLTSGKFGKMEKAEAGNQEGIGEVAEDIKESEDAPQEMPEDMTPEEANL